MSEDHALPIFIAFYSLLILLLAAVYCYVNLIDFRKWKAEYITLNMRWGQFGDMITQGVKEIRFIRHVVQRTRSKRRHQII
jgi:hypothetical protein